MYIIDKQKNSIEKIAEATFSDLGFKERNHLQEWLEGNPEALGEKFLIIQKEFSGFKETNERLDLLALDEKGNLVIIENKLDDTGKDVTWQALKYASYCSSLTKEEIKIIYQKYLTDQKSTEDAANKLSEFYNNAEYDELLINQKPKLLRIILVARYFRLEVTSTVLWLRRNFGINIQCFKVTPFALDEQQFLTIEQIIPTKDAEDYIITLVKKENEVQTTDEVLKERHHLRLEYWTKLLPMIKGKATIFQNSSAIKDQWLSVGGTGISGLYYQFVVTKSYASVELLFQKSNKTENERVFDELRQYENEINTVFGGVLKWERLNNNIRCRVACYQEGVSYFDRSDWQSMMEFQVTNMINLEKALKEPLKKVRQKLHEKEDTE